MAVVDVVVVSYNSRPWLRPCVDDLARAPDVRVTVVDNGSIDGSLDELEGLRVEAVITDANRGFGAACNVGWRRGDAPYVLFLNPDARIDVRSLWRLVEVLEREPAVGAAGPRIIDDRGSLDFSQRRFPRLRSTYARALLLHHLFPRAAWADEIVRSEDVYADARPAEWLSGACLLVRRIALEQLDGFDETFFMYCEDKDLCKQLWRSGHEVRYEPTALCAHVGGASAPRPMLAAMLAQSRVRYARKHHRRFVVGLERAGLVLESLIRLVLTRGGRPARAGHARSLRALIGRI